MSSAYRHDAPDPSAVTGKRHLARVSHRRPPRPESTWLHAEFPNPEEVHLQLADAGGDIPFEFGNAASITSAARVARSLPYHVARVAHLPHLHEPRH